MLKNLIKGIEIGFGIIIVLGLFLGIVFAVGFHTANEITSGSFNGNFDFSNATIIGFNAGISVDSPMECNISTQGQIKYNSSSYKYLGCNGETWETISSIPRSFISCKDILDTGYSTGNGIYEIDPDGTGNDDPYDVYCDMSNGGWTLINDFGTTNSYSGIDSISSTTELTNEGYTITSDNNAFAANYFQGWVGDAAIGYIQFTLPNWGNEYKVIWGNTNSGYGTVNLYLDENLIESTSTTPITSTGDYNGETNLKLNENSAIYTIYELWVK